jgi:hypothetical protein
MSDCPNPNWLVDLITSKSPPVYVDRYVYKNAFVFYTPIPGCCDQVSKVYDRCGTVVCSPDGGYTGNGDGRCPDFFGSAQGETRIWTAPR